MSYVNDASHFAGELGKLMDRLQKINAELFKRHMCGELDEHAQVDALIEIQHALYDLEEDLGLPLGIGRGHEPDL
ncbi:hypothetical protein [Pseudooceanicola sp. LIPI14-2-Ac024]|uniref:hypothetical protein n=1 Tax=Pseudooceanicola sp. LIPI14-2-Ac024 TaxID=3344875 RepID=UPI0035D0CEE5